MILIRTDKITSVAMGERIQRARKRAKITQMVFAEQIGVSTQYISDLERGVVDASLPTIIKIFDTLNVSSDYILRGIDSSTQQPADFLIEFQSFPSRKQKQILNGMKLLYEAFTDK